MAEKQPSATDGLEAQLRDMILGNVTMSPSPSQQQQHQQRGGRSANYNTRAGTGAGSSSGGDQRQRGDNRRQFPSNQNPSRTPQPARASSASQPPNLVPGSVQIQQRPQPRQQQLPMQSGPSAPLRSAYQRPARVRVPSGSPLEVDRRCQTLEVMARSILSQIGLSREEYHQKESFRQDLEDICQMAVKKAYESTHAPFRIKLVPFGSFASGFAMPGSDMDLALVSPNLPRDLFRVLQKRLLDLGIGARLISRTRVPILKICSHPHPELLKALREDREKYDAMTPAEQEEYDNPDATAKKDEVATEQTQEPVVETQDKVEGSDNAVRPQNVQQSGQDSVDARQPSSEGKVGHAASRVNVGDKSNDHDKAKPRKERRYTPWIKCGTLTDGF